jgi:putative hydrolase of the HAD superfamily
MYKHVFFDLDRTLWDFETNSYETLCELIEKYKLKEKGIVSIDNFIADYYKINDTLWDEYRKGTVDKETLRYQRFHKAFLKYGIEDEELTVNFGNDYVYLSPLKTNLFSHTIEVLEYLKPKYELHIITNGFEEVQHIKMKNSGIENYFSEIITSERAGFKKPDKRIFDFSMQLTNAFPAHSLMIGDSLEADIIGAKNAGLHQVFFNNHNQTHQEDVTYEIKSLKELFNFL